MYMFKWFYNSSEKEKQEKWRRKRKKSDFIRSWLRSSPCVPLIRDRWVTTRSSRSESSLRAKRNVVLANEVPLSRSLIVINPALCTPTIIDYPYLDLFRLSVEIVNACQNSWRRSNDRYASGSSAISLCRDSQKEGKREWSTMRNGKSWHVDLQWVHACTVTSPSIDMERNI